MIDHYEIQSRRVPRLGAGESQWEHVGNKYPDYKWEIRRPWYFLGLIRYPRIINQEAALKQVACDLLGILRQALAPDSEQVRIILWYRTFFGRLWKVKIIET